MTACVPHWCQEAALEAGDVALAVAAHLQPLLEAVQTEVAAELADVRAEPDAVLAHDHLREAHLAEHAGRAVLLLVLDWRGEREVRDQSRTAETWQ